MPKLLLILHSNYCKQLTQIMPVEVEEILEVDSENMHQFAI